MPTLKPNNMDFNYTHCSVDALRRQLSNALSAGAVMLSWSPAINQIHFLNVDDQDAYHRTLRLIKGELQSGQVSEVISGASLDVGEVQLFSMLVKSDHMCPAYFLLHGRNTNDVFYSPYYFTSENSRDNAVAYLTSTGHQMAPVLEDK